MFCGCGIQCRVIAWHDCVIGSSKLPYNDFFTKDLACGYSLPPADDVSPTGNTGLHTDTMWYDGEYVACHMAEIGTLWVRFLLMPPPVGYVQYPKCTVNLHWVGVVIIDILFNVPTIVWCFRRWIQIGPGGGQLACCAIASSGCHFSHIGRSQVFFIIAGQIIRIKE